MTEKNLFDLLRARRILDILNGDVSFGKLETNSLKGAIEISMPYLSGPELCNVSSKFGLPVSYKWNGINQSRWMYLDNLFAYCIKNKRESDLLSFLFSMEQFTNKLTGHTPEIIESAYTKIVETVISQINGELYFGGNELVQIGSRFFMKKIGTIVNIIAPSIKSINHEYIVDLSERAMQDVVDGNFDSAITKSRTLLEEVFCHVIEKKGEAPLENGDIGKLYNQVKLLYNMHQNKDMDKRINSLLSGLEKILSAIAEMRNKSSDSHGVGSKRVNISEHHARLFVNSAMTMADFVLAVGNRDTE